jgi:DNA-binding HxlR family transcriptional regulator/putative sterol carrier protein
MKIHTYNQFCPVAFALVLIGDRWTLLIIRELLTGPRRFKDLLEGLPGLSTNLLSERLKRLEQHGLLCRRVLPPPAGSTVYELTPWGQALDKVVLELGQWGLRLLPSSLEGVALPSVGSCALGLKAFFRGEQAQGVRETYELHLGQEVLQVQVREGELKVWQGQGLKADVVMQMDMLTYLGVISGQLDPAEAMARGLVRMEGDMSALSRFLDLFGLPASP